MSFFPRRRCSVVVSSIVRTARSAALSLWYFRGLSMVGRGTCIYRGSPTDGYAPDTDFVAYVLFLQALAQCGSE